jgi:hypothetical protein
VPRVGTRHTGTGGAADGVHAQCLRDSGLRCWGQESSGAPKQAARRSRVVPRSKQLGGVEWCPEASRRSRQAARRGDVEQSKQLGRQPDEAMSSRASG